MPSLREIQTGRKKFEDDASFKWSNQSFAVTTPIWLEQGKLKVDQVRWMKELQYTTEKMKWYLLV
jgi:hypothetical protein